MKYTQYPSRGLFFLLFVFLFPFLILFVIIAGEQCLLSQPVSEPASEQQAAIQLAVSVIHGPFSPTAIEIRCPVSTTSDEDKPIVEAAKWDTGVEVFNDQNELVAVWVRAIPSVVDSFKNRTDVVTRDKRGVWQILLRVDAKTDLTGGDFVSLTRTSLPTSDTVSPQFGLELELTEAAAARLAGTGPSPRRCFIVGDVIQSSGFIPLVPSPKSTLRLKIRFDGPGGEQQRKQMDTLWTRLAHLSKMAFAEKENQWQPMFDGKTLTGWESVEVGGEGDVEVKDGQLLLPMGATLTGVRYTKEFPVMNYEIEYTGQKLAGGDFFAALTFPVGRSHLTFINGGWGGTVVGVSNIDDRSADDNETAQFISFEDNTSYTFRIRVTPRKIQCWVDDDRVVDYVTYRHRLGLRMESDMFKPVGLASWITSGAVSDIRYRHLTHEESQETERAAQDYIDRFVR